jgi:hypothetical protein
MRPPRKYGLTRNCWLLQVQRGLAARATEIEAWSATVEYEATYAEGGGIDRNSAAASANRFETKR